MSASLSIATKTTDSGTHWVSPLLVAVALLMWLSSLTLLLTQPLSSLPIYFANRYLVLDATSLLFIVVVNTVFLGICVYLYSYHFAFNSIDNTIVSTRSGVGHEKSDLL